MFLGGHELLLGLNEYFTLSRVHSYKSRITSDPFLQVFAER